MSSSEKISVEQYKETQLQRLESGFVSCADLLTVNDYDDETDKEGFYVIPSAGDGVIGRYRSLKDMENDTPNIIVRKSVYDKLCNADRILKRKSGYKNCQIIVTYGYRSPEIQAKLYFDILAEKKENYPSLSDEELREIVHREIAFPDVAGHPTGGAVDVIIFDYKKGKFLDFGTEICQFDSKNIYYASDDITPEAKKNRRILRSVMCEQGFAPYDGEWWHFCYGDKEWAFYSNRRELRKKGDRKDIKTEKKVLYRQKEFSEISEIIYNDKFKTHVTDNRLRIRLAVQKDGRLTEKTLSILKRSGIEVMQDKRGFLAKTDDFPLEVLFVRDDDISKLVDAGVADIGIVGENVYRENASNSIIKKYLGFGKCFLALAIPNKPDSDIKVLQDLNGKRIATSYRRLTEEFLKEKDIKDVTIIDIAGSVEVAPLIDYADAIVDIVSTGGSLRQNNLKVLASILNSQSILIANRKSERDIEKKNIIDQLIQRISSYLTAKQFKRVNMIVPKASLLQVVEIINKREKIENMDDSVEDNIIDVEHNTIIDMKLPVITPIYGHEEEWCSLQTVMKLSEIWEKMEELKRLNVANILFFDIEGIIN